MSLCTGSDYSRIEQSDPVHPDAQAQRSGAKHVPACEQPFEQTAKRESNKTIIRFKLKGGWSFFE